MGGPAEIGKQGRHLWERFNEDEQVARLSRSQETQSLAFNVIKSQLIFIIFSNFNQHENDYVHKKLLIFFPVLMPPFDIVPTIQDGDLTLFGIAYSKFVYLKARILFWCFNIILDTDIL